MPSTSEPGIDPQSALKQDAQAVADEAKNVVDELKSEASTQVEQLTEQAKQQLSQATDKVRGLASEQKDLLATQVGGVADAIERVAADLESEGGPAAQYARVIADNAGKLSSSIRDNDVDQLLGMAQDFGRKQPAAFMGAAALLGFAASRFLMASARRTATQLPAVIENSSSTETYGYSSDTDTGTSNGVGGSSYSQPGRLS